MVSFYPGKGISYYSSFTLPIHDYIQYVIVCIRCDLKLLLVIFLYLHRARGGDTPSRACTGCDGKCLISEGCTNGMVRNYF